MFKRLIVRLLRKVGIRRIGINRNQLISIRYNEWKSCYNLSFKLYGGNVEVVNIDEIILTNIVSNINRLGEKVDKLGMLITENGILFACEDTKCGVLDIETCEINRDFEPGKLIKVWIDPDKFLKLLPR